MRATNFLIIVNVLVFILFPFLNLSVEDYGFSVSNLLKGKYYVFLTSLFLHGDIFHLFYNMFFLFFIGNVFERELGKKKLLLTYFLTGIFADFSFFFSIFGYTYQTVGIGASGAISGIIGYGAIAIPWKIVIIPPGYAIPFLILGTFYFISNFLNLFTPSSIAYPAHLFGLVSGAILALTIEKVFKK